MNKFVVVGAVAVAVGIGLAAKSQAPELARYLKIERM
jgi:hypothetical protein